MIETVEFPNVGYVKTKISEQLRQKLIRNFNRDLPKMITPLDLEGAFAPNHYFLKDEECLAELSQLTLECFKTFNKKYKNFLDIIKCELSPEIISKTHLELNKKQCWYNDQKTNLHIPAHRHEGMFSFVIWLSIPEAKKTRSFSFFYQNALGELSSQDVNCNKEDEGTLLFFSSRLWHCTYPYSSNETQENRLSLSGNINIKFNET